MRTHMGGGGQHILLPGPGDGEGMLTHWELTTSSVIAH